MCFINYAQFFAIFRWFFVKYGSFRVIPDFSNSLYIFGLLFRICFSSRWLEQTRKKEVGWDRDREELLIGRYRQSQGHPLILCTGLCMYTLKFWLFKCLEDQTALGKVKFEWKLPGYRQTSRISDWNAGDPPKMCRYTTRNTFQVHFISIKFSIKMICSVKIPKLRGRPYCILRNACKKHLISLESPNII